jgi:hypothetical protein
LICGLEPAVYHLLLLEALERFRWGEALRVGEAVMRKAVVSYIRVSTARQGRSGLGLEAQREAIAQFCRRENFAVRAEYIEVAARVRTHWNAGRSSPPRSRRRARQKGRS